MPNDSEASDDKDVVDAYFPQNARRETVILATQDGSDIITVERFNAVRALMNMPGLRSHMPDTRSVQPVGSSDS